ncbi:BTB/POZ domain-containing protein At3g22104-like [Pistacia vera]|uniref:BTB/POZ domain-containing protein At3g22104-like n=1 Tax=Pistacia vera TaxID=55513 RepID=UPI001262BCD3|nr:BTB/POZ domain-containing protein At3g22104-like [Pistacia vera]
MEVCCDLEVDVNGEETFMVDKRILASFSGRFGKLFSKLNRNTRKLKVIFNDFPGGAEGFELITRFCYNSGKTKITSRNIFLLSSAAIFMEMGCDDGSRKPNLIDQIEIPLEEINYWTWPGLLEALKQCQGLHSTADSSSFILDKVLHCLIERLGLPSVSSPCASFSDNSTLQFSRDFRNSVSTNYKHSQKTWWFEDLLFLNVDLLDKVIKMMISQNFDHGLISKFLFYYQRSRFLGASPAEKRHITAVVISLLSLLDKRSHSFKGLFEIFRGASSLSISKNYKSKLENLIGSQLDQATLDHLIIRSPRGKDYAYDVNLVLRLVKAFLSENDNWLSISRLNKVASLIDSYLAEVSPDSCLKPSKFAALLRVLPDSTRQSHDGLYCAMDMYLQVHSGLCKEEKLRVCSTLNYEKLSTDALKHIALNSRFPSEIAVKSFINQHYKLRTLVPKTKSVLTINHLDVKEYMGEKADARHIFICSKQHNLSTETEKFEAQFQGMNWKMKELEKVCRIMQTELGNITRTRLSTSKNARYLPKLCS